MTKFKSLSPSTLMSIQQYVEGIQKINERMNNYQHNAMVDIEKLNDEYAKGHSPHHKGDLIDIPVDIQKDGYTQFRVIKPIPRIKEIQEDGKTVLLVYFVFIGDYIGDGLEPKRGQIQQTIENHEPAESQAG